MVPDKATQSVADEILSHLGQFASISEAARELQRRTGDRFPEWEGARSYLRRRAAATDTPEPVRVEIQEDKTKDRVSFDFKGKLDRPMEVSELVAAHGIDLSKWEITKIRVGKSGVTGKLADRSSDGKIVAERLEAAQNYHISVELAPKRATADAAMNDAAERILAGVRAIVQGEPRQSKRPHPAFLTGDTDGNRMLEVSIFDLHLGKLAWDEETGMGDWDTRIGSSAALAAADDLLNFFPNYGRVWLPLGHDFFNSDGPGENGSSGRTTKGTPQDEDTRWAKSLNTGVDVALSLIELCKQHAPVDVTIMRGNHDEQRCVFLGRLLREVYRNDPHVTIDDGLGMLKSYSWGDVFLATHHGQLESFQKVVTECAIRFPSFGSARWREIHSGHGHRMKSAGMVVDGVEEQSVRLRMIPSLTPPDSYHARHLYHNHPSAECYLWHRTDLYEGHHAHNRVR